MNIEPNSDRFEFATAVHDSADEQNSNVQSPAKTITNVDPALRAANEAAYFWDIANDEISWSANAAEIMGCSLETISTPKHFATLLDQQNLASRYDTVMNSTAQDHGEGVLFELEYLFRPNGRNSTQSTWIEDRGRWFANDQGKPTKVYGIVRKIDARHARDQHLTFMGNCDALTGFMNRSRLTEALDETIQVVQREQTKCSFAIASLKNLATVNEAYGYDVADEVVVAISRRLKQVMRTGDAIARYSGGKFAVIFNSCDEQDLPIAVERLLSVVRDSVVETTRGPVWVMLAIGALTIPTHADTPSLAMMRAESTLHEAVQLPSDGYAIYRPSKSRVTEQMLNSRCATEIVRCLKTDGFKLAFQPIIDAKTLEVVHHEALLRMIDESGEVVSAGHLIPIAERLGLVRLIDRAVTQMAIATLHTYPDAVLAINVSANTATDPRWYHELLDMIRNNLSVSRRLTIEITETVALSDMDATRVFVESLRQLGCEVAIDDFGAGYTSFRNLRDLPVNVIKIDGSYCRGLAASEENLIFVKSLIDLAHAFGHKVVAEWVATEEDARILTEIGADHLQGNFHGAASLTPPWKASNGAGFMSTDAAIVSNEPMTISTIRLNEAFVVEDTDVPEANSAVAKATAVDVAMELTIQPEADVTTVIEETIQPVEPQPEMHSAANMETRLETQLETNLETEQDSSIFEDDNDDSVSKLREALGFLNTIKKKSASDDEMLVAI